MPLEMEGGAPDVFVLGAEAGEIPTDLSSLSNFDWSEFFLSLAKRGVNACLCSPFRSLISLSLCFCVLPLVLCSSVHWLVVWVCFVCGLLGCV